ncbi:DUF4129 domain-containing protein [Deminuibacter soli]|uniref:DUF4129 domain-containing protein n=1 Tax=Deminuibacter soli TaxID=2291815 RepID=A0A3E1NM10_9BACT|nr:DUF4129 domain-containing protein [Deminuibacter soli]RFM28965.1 DUF4129 domain-containing protein [Deminuibacter soli]
MSIHFTAVKRLLHAAGTLPVLLAIMLLPAQGKAQAAASADSLQTTADTATVIAGDEGEQAAGEDSTRYNVNSKAYYDEPFLTEPLQSDTATNAAVREMKAADAYWYISEAENKQLSHKPAENDNEPEIPVTGAGVTFIFWAVVIVIFIAGIVYFLQANKISIFTRSGRGHPAAGDSSDLLHENIFELPYADLLQKAYAAKDFRLAVRILFLQTLKMMSQQSVIHYQPDYTNIHYLTQLQQTPYHHAFLNITRHYEYIWYGQFAITEPVFESVKNDFLAMQKLLA